MPSRDIKPKTRTPPAHTNACKADGGVQYLNNSRIIALLPPRRREANGRPIAWEGSVMDNRPHAVILSGASALRAIRRERRIYGELTWNPIEIDEQIDALKRATCLDGLIDLDRFEQMGIFGEGEELDVALMRTARRTPAPPVRAHCISNLADGGLLRIARDTYILSPAALLIDLAASLTFEELLALAEELCGSWSLPERQLKPGEIAENIDFIDKPCGYYEGKPVLDIKQLADFHAQATRMRGRKAAEAVVHCAVGGSRSPMEAIMNCVYAIPHQYGGLNCGPVRTNHRIDFNDTAHALSHLPYVLADAYLPRFNTVLEYNGSYHDEPSIRRRDEARTLGLMSMGFDVYRLNSDQLRDAEALETIARMIYRRSGRHFRPRAKKYTEKRSSLLKGLRKALGLDQREAIAGDRTCYQLSNSTDV